MPLKDITPANILSITVLEDEEEYRSALYLFARLREKKEAQLIEVKDHLSGLIITYEKELEL